MTSPTITARVFLRPDEAQHARAEAERQNISISQWFREGRGLPPLPRGGAEVGKLGGRPKRASQPRAIVR